jgi:hypothetical protein
VVELAWSDDPDRYDGCTVTTGRVSHAKEVKSDGTDKNRYLAAPSRGLREGLRSSSLKNTQCCEDTMSLKISVDPLPKIDRYQEDCARGIG